ncbi:hypothetical protein AKAW_11407 [Aspergillus luchuensis IFO 4308]|nr:hypothetical protein AKAW_11407 [Aspergillus luchuensis IFO 4308]
MYTRAQVLAALAAISASGANAAMAISTLILRNGPSGGFSDAITSLWVGMGTSNSDLIQSNADNWQQSNWTMYAYTLMETSATTQEPIYGDGQADGTKGDKVTMHSKYRDTHKFDGSTGSYT